jgi:hypothetical protein
MADERVVIKIDINADTSAIDRVQRKLRALAAEAELTNQRMRGLNSSLEDNADAADKVDKAHTGAAKSVSSHGSEQDRFSKRLKRNEKDLDIHQKMIKGLSSILKTGLKFGLIGASIEMVAMGAALASVNGLLGLGQVAMKAYRFAMSGVAAGAAAGVIALSTLVAAQREYNGAIAAFQYKSAPQLGKGTAQAMSAMRNLTSDTRLGVFGMQNLNAAFAAVSKNAEMTGGLQNALVGLGDFAVAAGGDIGKNIAAAGEFLGLLQKEGSLTEDVLSSAAKVGPQFAAAVEEAKKKGLTGASDIISALSSGDLAKQSGLEGALSAVNDTLIGQLKSFMTGMQTQFGDLGQQFLPQVKTAFSEINSSLQIAFTRINGSIAAFGGGSLIEGLVSGLTKVIDLSVTLFEKYLPQSKNMFSGFGSFFDKAKKMFGDFKEGLKGLSEGAKVITDTFGPVFIKIFKNFGDSINTLSTLAEENKEEFAAFGDSLANIFTAVQNAFNSFKAIVIANLPIITGLFNVLASAINIIAGGITALLGGLGKLGGLGGALSTLMLVGGAIGIKGAMNNFTGKKTLAGAATNKVKDRFVAGQGRGGGISSTTGIMNVTATTVNITSGGGLGGGGGTNGPADPSGSSKWRPGYTMDDKGKYIPIKGQQSQRNAAILTSAKGLPSKGVAAGKSAFGKGKAALGSPGGKMGGAMAGQAALMAMADEDASPFIAAGSMVSMVNPLAGLAVSGLGTAATSKTVGGGAAAGALGGAAAGAVIGTALGGPVVGTAIGAALGLGFGAVMGNVNADKAERANEKGLAKGVALDAAGTFSEKLYTGGPEAAKKSLAGMQEKMKSVFELEEEYSTITLNGQKRNATQAERTAKAETALREGRITQLQYDAVTKEHMGTYMKELKKQSAALDEVANVKMDEFTRKTTTLSTATGKSEQELAKLATQMGVDLTDGTLSLSDAMAKLGLATTKTLEEIMAATRKTFATSIEETYGEPLKKSEAEQAVNQAATGLQQTGPGFTESQYNQFMVTLARNAEVLFKGDAVGAAKYMQEQVGAGGKQFQLGPDGVPGPLYGLEGRFQEFGAGAKTSETLKQTINTQATASTANLTTGLLAGSEMGMSQDFVNKIQNALTLGLTTGAGQVKDANGNAVPVDMAYIMTRMNELAAAGGVKDASGNIIKGESGAVALEQELSAIFGPLLTDPKFDVQSQEDLNTAAKGAAEAMSKAAQDMGNSITSLIESQPSWWSSPPGWYNDGSKPAWIGADTTTPRASGDSTSSRLGRTMGRHGFFDSQLAGSRTVTSAWRDNNLGSINSDHVTGNAYDLTGQNLGAYGTMVNQMGGFAEFHGAGGGRHLHVVPGQTPVGDSMSPVASSGVAVMSGGSNSYSITINTQPGQDANAIAQEVMARIDERDRSNRERQ